MITLSPWWIYFADLVDTLNVLFALVWIFSLLIILFIVFNIDDVCEDSKKTGITTIKILFTIFIIFGLLNIFSPSTQTIYKMMIIPPVVNSSVVQKLPDELQKYIDKVLSTEDDK